MIREIIEHQSRVPMDPADRFTVRYRLEGDEAEARARAQDICLEQTVEFPDDLVPQGFIRDHVLGRIESFEKAGDFFSAAISFPAADAAGEFTQLLNVIFGNISIKPGIYIDSVELPPSILGLFRGPRFGIDGLRARLGVPRGPLLSTALKPMGLTSDGLTALAYAFARGGIDIIKDDHGLTDQPYAPFRERVKSCAAAVRRANGETGFGSVYAANVTASCADIMERARFAREAGAGALLIAPGITGFDAVKRLSEDDGIALPIISHPALQGSFVMGGNGISHRCLFGQLARLSGADASIYPNFGGRFSFTRAECRDIVDGCTRPMGSIAPIFPSPGGGMTLENVPEMREFYGDEVIYLMGGGLFRRSDDLAENCRHFRKMIGR